jgi:hypothetical protein
MTPQMFAAATTGTAAPPIAVTILVAVISSGVVAAFVNAVSGNLRANANLRRDRYAQAVRCLVAWNEYPYRIRRRVDDEPSTRAALADRGHTLQEQRAEISGWISTESRALSVVFGQCVHELSAVVGPACNEAWRSPPITTGAGMNLIDFGPRGVTVIAARLEWASRYRFGLRRLMWSSWVLRRVREHDRITARPLPAPTARPLPAPTGRPVSDAGSAAPGRTPAPRADTGP